LYYLARIANLSRNMAGSMMNRAFRLRSLPRMAFAVGVLLLLLLLLDGCKQAEDSLVEDTFTQTYPVEPNVRISLKNTDGSFHIYGSADPEVKVQAVKKAYGRERLDKIAVNVTNAAGIFSLDTSYPPKPKLSLTDRSGTVDYTIILPQTCTISKLDLNTGEVLIDGLRGGKVSASLVNGRMSDHNGFGQHQLFVANGGLDVAFDWWQKQTFSVEAKIVNGNLRAFIPSASQFHLIAKTVDGNIENDFTDQEHRHRGFTRSVDSLIGDHPDPEITLQATNGNIKVAQFNP
jgi:hypothetical protein